MSKDTVLRLSNSRIFPGKKKTLRFVEPSDLVRVRKGILTEPPDGLWSVESGYAQGESNPQLLSKWLKECCGKPLLSALRAAYPAEGLLRVLMTAEADLEPELMMMPWEILELPGEDWGTTERLTVVRCFQSEVDVQYPAGTADQLKIAILWADPDRNIPERMKHLNWIKEFFDNRPIEFKVIGPEEFTDHETIREKLSLVHPDIVYHIGHAEPLPTGLVALRIGPQGRPFPERAVDFIRLLQEIGPPRLLFLNSCSTTLGWEMNPYLGIALACGRSIDAVLAMQTEVPTSAAMAFAREFFPRLASGIGLSAALKHSRNALQRLSLPTSFTPFIPVLIQRTRQDHVISVDPTGRLFRFLLKELQFKIESIDPLLDRSFDLKLGALFENDAPRTRVTVIQGVNQSGKSTSLRKAVRERLTDERFRAGERPLYFDASLFSGGVEANGRIGELLCSFAQQYRPLTESLAADLSTRKGLDPQGQIHPLSILATWFEDEQRAGHRYHLIIDHLDSALAAVMADYACRVITNAGCLVLVAEDPPLDPAWPVSRLSLDRMSRDEIGAALAAFGLPHAPEDVDRLMLFSNGFPYFVSGYVRRRSLPNVPSDDLAKTFIESRIRNLSRDEKDILELAALCREPLPLEILENHRLSKIAEALADEDHLLIKVGDGTFRLPEGLRAYLASLASERVDLRESVFNGFLDMAEAGDKSQDEAAFQAVTRWYAEAFRQALAIAAKERDIGKLDAAQDIAKVLHDRYSNLGEASLARLVWENYRDAAQDLGRDNDRLSDIYYAGCLIQTAEYEVAELLLDQATAGKEIDQIQMIALFLWSRLEKDRGTGGWGGRCIAKLREALKIAQELENAGSDPRWIKTQIASLWHSLGNALGYGREAKLEEAIDLLEQSQKMYKELNDPLRFRAISEQIEIKRYNNLLSSEEIESSKKILQENVLELVARDMQYDAVRHLYELGRLEAKPAMRAGWYQQAFQRAGKILEPDNWHAGIHWRQSQVEAGIMAFAEAAPFLSEYADRLRPWENQAWSRRERRDVLRYLAEGCLKAEDTAKAHLLAKECWSLVENIPRADEGRADRSARRRISALIIRLALAQGMIDQARAIVATQAGMEGEDTAKAAEMNPNDLERYAEMMDKEET